MSQRFALSLMATVMAVSLLSTPVYAQVSRIYFAGYLGLNTSNDQDFSESTTSTSGDIEMGNTSIYAGALGIRLSRQFRFEGELSYRKTDLSRITFKNGGDFQAGGELRTWLALANLYYDFDVKWKNIQPFVGAGVGWGWHAGEINDTSGLAVDASDDSAAIAWQLGGGLKYQVRPGLAFTGAYRYVDTFDLEFEGYEWDYGTHEFLLGLQYDLPVR